MSKSINKSDLVSNWKDEEPDNAIKESADSNNYVPGSSLLTCDVTLLLFNSSVNLVQSEGKEHPSRDVKGVTHFNEESRPEDHGISFPEPEGNAWTEERANKQEVSHSD